MPDLQNLWDTMVMEDLPFIKKEAAFILSHQDTYLEVVEGTSISWQFIGVTHYREANCDFTCHPHNGDSLKKRTINVPSGRPIDGNPPFSWQESAKDCYITVKKLDKIETWDIPTILDLLERFNGLGYRKYHPNVLSPYLWSYTNHYTIGKYGSDGKFDPNLKDKQIGTAPLYRFLTDKTLGLV